MEVQVPSKIGKVFAYPRGTLRNRVLYGGRGSGKSFNAALMASIWGLQDKLRILCVREFQVSIKESMFAEIAKAINSNPTLAEFYDIGKDYIRGRNGTEFIFKGLRYNIDNIKSMSDIDICIVEEAENLSAASWLALLPTIRSEKSEIWVIFNPRSKDSWVAQQFILSDKLPPRTIVASVNYQDNPWFTSVLDELRQYDREHMNPAMYSHVWEGAFYEETEATIFKGHYKVSDNVPEGGAVYYGLDFGFSQSPTAANRVVVKDNILYITHELNALRLPLDDTVKRLKDALPGVEEYIIRADNARPESIEHLKNKGLPKIMPCSKGPGSIKDGIEYMRSFDKIIIHPRCEFTIENFNLYSFKIDRHSGAVTPDIIDAYNDHIDAIRYALEGRTKRKSSIFDLR